MSHGTSAIGPPTEFGGNSFDWVRFVPDGAVSVAKVEGSLVLRASEKLQQRFEDLLSRRKLGTLSPDECEQYEAICELDEALSWLNRLTRGVRTGIVGTWPLLPRRERSSASVPVIVANTAMPSVCCTFGNATSPTAITRRKVIACSRASVDVHLKVAVVAGGPTAVDGQDVTGHVAVLRRRQE